MARSFRGGVRPIAAATFVVLASLVIGAAACSDSEPPPKSSVPLEEPKEDLKALPYNPQFEPDVNNLTARPGVEPATKAEQDFAVVKPDTLEFPADKAPSVRDWEPGRIVASGQGGADNPLGYARKIVSVAETNGTFVVQTEPATLRELVSGDLRVRVDDHEGTYPDISKLDPEWVAKNLYGELPLLESALHERLKSDPRLADDEPAGLPGSGGFFDDVGAALRSAKDTAAKSINDAMGALGNVTVQGQYNKDGVQIGASISSRRLDAAGQFNPEIKVLDINHDVLKNWEWEKKIEKAHITVFLKGNLKLIAGATVNPGFQFQAFVPFEDSMKADTFIGVKVDARAQSKIQVKGDLEVGLKAADVDGSTYGSAELRKQIEKGTDVAEKALSSFRTNVFGNEDVKPEGVITKTLWISSPKSFTVTAGPVPIVLTSTLQLDLICSFEAKATLTYDLSLDQVATFKFDAMVRPYATEARERVMLQGPKFAYAKNFTKEILGGGEISLSCGLAPRVNVLLYDTAGVNFGLRGSLKAKLTYASKCQDHTTTPKGDLSLGLYANYGVRVGGRLQAPGSSLLGTKGQDLGIDIGPFEPWNDEKELKKWDWSFDKGIGYCTPLCRNNTLNDGEATSKGKETDVDCGGGSCNACPGGKKCSVHTDCDGNHVTCDNGVCGTNACANKIKDGDETDVDCGGKCGGCAIGRACSANANCASGFCSRSTLKCVATSCENAQRDGNECATDCGGSCGACENWKQCGKASQCKSGFSNGLVCMPDSCLDGVRSGNETDRDCGGSTSCNRCGVGMACDGDADCQGGYTCTNRVCARIPAPTCSDRIKNQDETDRDCGGGKCENRCDNGKGCGVAADCRSFVCTGGSCATPTCSDFVKNGAETGTDCGGTCSRCAAGLGCSGPQDCVSNVCLQGGTCAGAYTLGGTISGLVGSVTLGGTGVTSVTRNADGAYTFPAPLVQGAQYQVDVVTQPTGRSCAVANGSGTMGAANVSNVNVTCTTNSYAFGGTVSGATGALVLRDNVSGGTLPLSGSGSYSFGSRPYGASYDVVVQTPPANQTCTVTNGLGTMGAGAVTNVSVSCTTIMRSVGGTVTGATGALVLTNGSESLNVSGSGGFTFTQPVASGTGYAVSVLTPPPNQTCSVTSGSGTMGSTNVTTVSVTCSTIVRTVGGVVSGASGALILKNGSETLNRPGNGAFTFTQPVASGATYGVSVDTPPAGQACTVTNGSGTIGGSNVTDVAVSCTTTYSVGGTVTGASGALVLRNNGTDTVNMGGDGSFTFTQKLANGAPFAVTVTTPPAGQICSVANGSGNIQGANHSSVTVTCYSATGFKRVFVTSTTYTGGHGGKAGADAACATRATAAGLPGTFKAWLTAGSSEDPESTFTRATIPYRRMDGVDIASSWTDLTDGTLAFPLNVTELNTTVNVSVWSSVRPDGTDIGATNCLGYNTNDGAVYGQIGASSATNGGWTQGGTSLCNNQLALYCFEQ